MGMLAAEQTEAARGGLTLAWPRLTLAHLYFLIPLVGLTAYAALVPTPPNDFWWHMRIGQMIVEQGRVPETNIFAWTLPAETRYIYNSWLAEVLHFLIYRAGGMELVTFSRNVLLFLALGVVGLEAQRRSGSWVLAGLGVTVAGAVSLNNLIVRPQNWSWPAFVLLFFILSRYAEGKLRPAWLLTLPLIMVYWVNTHGVFTLGLIMIGAFVAGEAIRHWLRLPGALPRRAVVWLGAAAVASGLVTLLNPYGLGLYPYLLSMTNNANQRYVVEWWQPSFTDPVGRLFYASILVLMAALAFARRRPTPADVLLLAAFIWLAWSMVRTVTWYGLVAGPILAQCLARPREARPASAPTGAQVAINYGLAAVLLGMLALVQPWFVRALPLPDYYQERVLDPALAGPLLSANTPVAATEHLRRHPGGRLFHEMGYGSYLIWRLPEQPVFIDSRVEMFPTKIVEDYVAISTTKEGLDLLASYGIDRVMLDLDEQPKLAANLAGRPGWEREYADATTEIWRYRP